MITNTDLIIRPAVNEEVPNLGSVITLDNKGRLINSQFSKPSSSQNLLKLNHSEEIPDADDLPYAIISYGDTPNLINLPYNDHNYFTPQNTKKIENYDKKALDYLSKQSTQSSSRSSFNTTGSVRISHFSSYNSSTSQNDSFLFNDKYKPQHQFTFNQQVSHTSTPLSTNKTMTIVTHNNNNNIYPKNNFMPGAIVISSGSVNKLKGVNVIQLRRPSHDSAKVGETRLINLPLKKPSVLTNIIGNNQVNSDRDINVDKSDISKSISLIPRCICRFTHDDGGMIRCEICQTWQHIVCMYPDNQFPIYYKCECCEPRDIDVKRAITTQTNILIKSGHKPSDFLVNQDFSDYYLDNDSENNFAKSNVSHQFVIVKPDTKTISTNTIPIYITASKDGHTVPPGSPRTSKRKQDLISCKSILTKPHVITSKLNINNAVNNKLEGYRPSSTSIDTPYNYSIIPTSTYKTQSDMRQYATSPYLVNSMSSQLKTTLTTNVRIHTNLSVNNLQYLKQNNFIINTNMYDVLMLDYSRYAVKSVVEFNSNEIIMEYNGYVSLADEYNKDYDFRKHYNPFVLFYDKCDRIPMSVDSNAFENKARYVRRSCTPNAEIKHRVLQDGQIRFYIVPVNKIYKQTEITIPFDYNFLKCRYEVECACNQPSCQLAFLRLGTESQKVTEDLDYERSLNMYECVNPGVENVRSVVNMTRPYKKRGRGSKVLNTVCRPQPSSPNNTVIANDLSRTSLKIIRRNKRGRPPLNRAAGINRADIVPMNIPTQDTSFNLDKISSEHLRDDLSDHLYSNYSTSNENSQPHITIHTNFKNFKRIPSSHWSLKTTRKLSTIPKKQKPLNKLTMTAKVGRPFKVKAEEAIVSEHEEDYPSDHSYSSRECKPPKSSNNEEQDNNSNEENNRSSSVHSNKDDLSREDEGKYWLEEINSKILKQKVKEAKKVQRKSKVRRKRNNENKTKVYVEKLKEQSPTKELNEEKEFKEAKEIIEHIEPAVEVKIDMLTPKKLKRIRKNQKQNVNYILSYKPSNIDDLKNDLMLITASLEEDKEEEEVVDNALINEACEVSKISLEYADNSVENVKEIVDHVEKCIEHIEESVEHIEESVEHMEESIVHMEESVVHMEESVVHMEESVVHMEESPGNVDESGKHDESLIEEVEVSLERISEPVSEIADLIMKNEMPKDNIEKENSCKVNESTENELNRPKIKRVSRKNKGDKDSSSKASREERWVNTMWQRILKNEDHFDRKTKRRRSKSSAAEGSIASEENRNDTSEIGSPKIGNSEISEDRDSSSNSKSTNTQKLSRKSKIAAIECDNCQEDHYLKLVDCEVKNEKWNNTFSTTSSNSADDHQANDHKDVYSEQCCLIVYKEQHSNPMEKFSRENSAKLFTPNNVLEIIVTTASGNINPPAHTKKRWLSQALMEETFNEETLSPKSDLKEELDIIDKLSSIDIVSNRSFLPPVFTTVDNTDLSSTNPQKIAMNPKKRLLNQFSLEDNALRTNTDNSPNNVISSAIPFKLSKSETSIDQEQSKTKLTLSEYRKRRFVDKSPKDFSNSMTKYQKNSTEFNNARRALDEITQKKEKIINDQLEFEDNNSKVKVEPTDTLDTVEHSVIPPLSYIGTLNNLSIPSLIDPRLSSRVSSSTDNVVLDFPVICYEDSHNLINNEIFEPKSPSCSPTSLSDYKLFRGGPRTPSENGDIGNNVSTPEVSLRSFDSHPSPTSDCHFDFEKDKSTFIENEKTTSVTEPWTINWTSHTATIGKMAGIKNPNLLQEIEEFEDEYVPMPENLPERSKEEMETLLLTQKRDSQIREWQEVKQLEREKVKLDHQVRSMARRLHRVNKKMKTSSEVTENRGTKNTLNNYDVKDDEKTMKTFNIQLVGINGRLMNQINMLKDNNNGDKGCRRLKPDHIKLPLSYKYTGDNIIKSEHLSKYSRRWKKPAVPMDNFKTYNELENPTIPSDKLPNETALLTLLSNQNPTIMTISNQKSPDTYVSKQKTTQMISPNQIVINLSNQNQSLIISNHIEKITSMNTSTSGVNNIHSSLSSSLPSEIRSTLV